MLDSSDVILVLIIVIIALTIALITLLAIIFILLSKLNNSGKENASSANDVNKQKKAEKEKKKDDQEKKERQLKQEKPKTQEKKEGGGFDEAETLSQFDETELLINGGKGAQETSPTHHAFASQSLNKDLSGGISQNGIPNPYQSYISNPYHNRDQGSGEMFYIGLIDIEDDNNKHFSPSENGKVVIGRGDKADIKINDMEVSAIHCEIIKEGDGFLLRQIGVTNPTVLNDSTEIMKDGPGAALKGGDLLKIGHNTYRIQIDYKGRKY